MAMARVRAHNPDSPPRTADATRGSHRGPRAAGPADTHITRRETIDDIILTGPAARRDARERVETSD